MAFLEIFINNIILIVMLIIIMVGYYYYKQSQKVEIYTITIKDIKAKTMVADIQKLSRVFQRSRIGNEFFNYDLSKYNNVVNNVSKAYKLNATYTTSKGIINGSLFVALMGRQPVVLSAGAALKEDSISSDDIINGYLFPMDMPAVDSNGVYIDYIFLDHSRAKNIPTRIYVSNDKDEQSFIANFMMPIERYNPPPVEQVATVVSPPTEPKVSNYTTIRYDMI